MKEKLREVGERGRNGEVRNESERKVETEEKSTGGKPGRERERSVEGLRHEVRDLNEGKQAKLRRKMILEQ